MNKTGCISDVMKKVGCISDVMNKAGMCDESINYVTSEISFCSSLVNSEPTWLRPQEFIII